MEVERAVSEDRASRRTSYYVLALLLLGYVFNYLDRYVLTILLPAIKADLGLSDAGWAKRRGRPRLPPRS